MTGWLRLGGGLSILCAGLASLSAAEETSSPPPAAPSAATDAPASNWVDPIEYQPYRVAVRLSAADSAAASFTESLRAALPPVIAKAIGGRWIVDIDEPAADAPAPDVRYDLIVTKRAGEARVTVSAEEPLFAHQSPTRELVAADPRDLPARIVLTMAELFRPQATWERSGDSEVLLRVRGAAFAEADPACALLRETELFAPWIVFRTKEGRPQRVSEVPLTLYVLSKPPAGRGPARVVSGLRSPLTSRPRGRVELVAVAARPQWSQTRVELQGLAQPPRPLVAHEVDVTQGLLDEPATPPSARRLISNRHGMITLDVDPGLPWVTLAVHSGDRLLAEVPLVPGSKPTVRLDLPDDLLRLRAEGQLRLLQGELVAVVAERTALMVAARAAAKQGAHDIASALLKELQGLKTAESIRENVSAIRVPAVARARELKDVFAERRVTRLCDETEELIRKHLADDKVKLLDEELTELREAAADRASQ